MNNYPRYVDCFPYSQHLYDEINWDKFVFWENDLVPRAGIGEFTRLQNLGFGDDNFHPSENANYEWSKFLKTKIYGFDSFTGLKEDWLGTKNPIGSMDLKGQIPIGLVELKAGVNKEHEEISKECIKMIRDKIGPVAAFKTAIVIKRLPKTRSGKVLRGTMRKIADKEEYKMPATIDDPTILDEIKDSLKLASII